MWHHDAAVPYSNKCRVRTFVVLVEASEGVTYDILRVRAVELLPKHSEEHGEVDRPGSLPHHLFQGLVRWVLAYSSNEEERWGGVSQN